jgi:hypothetical protein
MAASCCWARSASTSPTSPSVTSLKICTFPLIRFNTRHSTTTGSQSFEKFKYPSLVTWIGCLFCSIYGLAFAHLREEKPNAIPHRERIRLGLLFTCNYLPTNYALLFISYPLQVVVKNARYILVVVVGVFFSRVKKSKELKLPRSKLYIGLLITIGAGLFMYYEKVKVRLLRARKPSSST